jgi:hypothetical protein
MTFLTPKHSSLVFLSHKFRIGRSTFWDADLKLWWLKDEFSGRIGEPDGIGIRDVA